ncbi:MAG: hypothetical protein JXB04_09985 [Kiritimatiellae bacterium]|nr:hypothetical protein [Kiritimatiellia bacterium]
MLAAEPEDFEIEPPTPSVTSAALSTSRRFLATGGTSADNVQLAEWAEQVAVKCADLVGWPPMFQRGDPLVLALRPVAGSAGGRIVKAQGLVAGRLRQKLIVYGVEDVDQEDLLEALAWLLLNRYVFERQDPDAQPAEASEAPDWLAAGVAQNLYAALRARNGRMMLRAWEQGLAPSFEALLAYEVLPEGRWIEKAAAGMACAWWQSLPDPEARWAALFQRLAQKDVVSAGWLATEGAGLESVAALEQNWDLWLAHREQIRADWGTVTPEDLSKLREALVVDAELLRLVGWEDPPAAMPPERLIDHRRERWIPTLAMYVGFKVKNLALGRAGEYQDVVMLYSTFWDALARRGVFRPSARRLRRMLAEAHGAFSTLETEIGRRAPADAGRQEVWPSFAGRGGDASEQPVTLPAIRIMPLFPAFAGAPGA